MSEYFNALVVIILIRIAIVDDEDYICSQVETILLNLAKKHSIRVEIDIYNNGTYFHKNLESGEFYDVVFLDIEMQGLSGLDISNILREKMKNEAIQIIYISGKTKYAIEVFDFDPIHFLPKPLTDEKIEKAFVKLLNKLSLKAEAFAYRIGNDIFKVAIRDILYFENDKRKITIYFRDKKAQFYGSLEDIERQLYQYGFLRIHKSYLINRLYARKFSYENVEMSNHIILPISQSRRKEIRALQFEIDITKGE